MNTIRAVIFDLGNVLVNFDHRRAAERICAFTDKTPGEIYDLFFDSEITGLFEEGAVAPESFYQKVRELLASDISYESFRPIWNEIFFLSDDNREVVSIARQLRDSHQVCVLSNINALHLEYIRNNFTFLAEFHRVFASCELKLRKPDPRIYRRVAETLGVSLQQCFYADDRPELVSAARSLGMQAYVYRTPQQLRVDLQVNQKGVFSKNS